MHICHFRENENGSYFDLRNYCFFETFLSNHSQKDGILVLGFLWYLLGIWIRFMTYIAIFMMHMVYKDGGHL
jgi:hypothetical protein